MLQIVTVCKNIKKLFFVTESTMDLKIEASWRKLDVRIFFVISLNVERWAYEAWRKFKKFVWYLKFDKLAIKDCTPIFQGLL